MIVKKFMVLFSVFVALAVPSVYATEAKVEVKAEVRAESSDKSGSRPGLLRSFLTKGKAAIGNGTLTAKSGTTLTVTRDGKTYTVLTDANTQFRRKFWGKGTLDEMRTGDTVIIIGAWTDEARTTIQARLVRDVSIQKRHGVFFGIVKSLTSNGWVLTTKRGEQTVTVSASTAFVNRAGDTIVKSDVAVGHRVRVRGLWDSSANVITDVVGVKDFSIKAEVESTPTATPTP